MKQKTDGNRRGKAALWISWLFTMAVFAFGAAVDVDFVDTSVSLSEAWQSASLSHMARIYHQEEYAVVASVSVAAVLLYTFHSSSMIRLGAMLAGFLTPIVAIGPVVLAVMVLAPWMVVSLPFHPADGEFYDEGMLMFAACGLWMIPCLALAAKEAKKLWCSRRSPAMEAA